MVFVFVYKLQTNINKLDKKNVWLYKIIFVTYDFFRGFLQKTTTILSSSVILNYKQKN